MIRGIAPAAPRPRRWVPCFVACVALIAPGPARAGLAISVQDVIAAAGSSGASLDVLLTNTGPGAVTIGGFNFELTVGNAAITFTSVTTSTSPSPYIFGGLGLVGPNIGLVVTGQDIMASDLYSVIGAGTTLGSGVTMGLGHLRFNVSPAISPGVNAVHLAAFPATSLSNPSGGNVPITTVKDGSITISGVPEPASLGLVGSGVALSAVVMASRRRRKG